MNNYPLGSDTPDAPWNQEKQEPLKVKATIYLTISKTVDLEVDDYDYEDYVDEDGLDMTDYDFSNCDLKRAAREQINIPSDWCEDDMEVNLEE